MNQNAIPETTLEQLEFQRALDCIAKLAVSELGATSIRKRRPGFDIGVVRKELDETDQLAALLNDDGALAAVRVDDISNHLQHLSVAGSVLDGEELLLIADTLEATRKLMNSLEKVKGELPCAEAYIVELPDRSVEKSIFSSLERDGTVKDDASPELARARREVRATRNRLVGTMEKTLRNLDPGDRASDATVTFRSGRYVLPVSREARSRVKGIIHGESGTGATLFIEPGGAVELGNELREWEAKESRAVLAVFRSLSERVREVLDLTKWGWEACVAFDDLFARARYVCLLEGAKPQISEAPSALVLRDARHPVLLDDGVDVVPSSLELDGEGRALVVSGPNAGGKTVLLKTTGLVCLMAQAGIIPPVGPGSCIPLFSKVFTDIGDRQSIAESLSTYSAHLKALKTIVEIAGPDTLVLIDEFGTGTDPAEGAALASAILLALNGNGATTLVTTHLSPLKELAAQTEGIVNASIRFDETRLASTFELVVGVPGRSYGLAMARSLGMPDDVLRRAEDLMPRVEREIESLLEDLNARDAELVQLEQRLVAREKDLEQRLSSVGAREEDWEKRASALRMKEKDLETEGREKARQFMLEARKRVENALELARGASTPDQARAARRAVERGVKEEGEAISELAQKMEAKGWRVRGLESSAGKTESKPSRRKIGNVSAPAVRTATLNARSEVSLRGLREADAEYEVIQALDAAFAADLGMLRIIHGKGTGALRAMVQRVLSNDPRIHKHSFASLAEGGAGVTIAEFK